MGLVSKTVKVKWYGANKKHYESFGYVYTKIGDEFVTRVEHLPKCSEVKVKCKCDGCGKDFSPSYNNYNKHVKEDGSTYCQTCGNNLAKKGEAFSKSFYDWCVENGEIGQNSLLRWDYELNKCSPKEVSYASNKKYYFKCDTHKDHESEAKKISSITINRKGFVKCNQCNSIAQYILDNFPNKDLYEVWNKEKNTNINPWNVSRGCDSKKYWFICQEKDYHESYDTTCVNFTSGQRCPYCTNRHGKVHPKDSLGQYIVDNYGEDFLHKVWSDKNEISPFEVSPRSEKKVWWKCLEGVHDDYLRKCDKSFIRDFRCPKCSENNRESLIEKRTKAYLQELGYKIFTEHSCSVKATNPKTKMPMPYDNEIVLHNGKHLIIEVHGEQHYNCRFYKSKFNITDEEAEKMLKQRRLYDRYKKAYAEHFDYEYLELPYWSFEGKNKDLYKQIIDNKIKEILEKEEIA